MNYYKAKIKYDGSNYFGFQCQKNIPTIQNDFNLSLTKILKGKITTMGSSRTDSGVHALEQIVKITSEDAIECKSFLVLLNGTLPSQIKCVSIMPCESSFQPTSHSASKEYRYLFTNTLKSMPGDQKYIANNPYPLDINLMKKCSETVLGTHSFHNFCSSGSNVKTTVRTVYKCEFSEIDPHTILNDSDLFPLSEDFRSCYQLRIEGNGFLKQMVRHLMSAFWLVGNNRMSLNDFSFLLDGPLKTKRLWKVASSRGLFLYRFNSTSDLFID